MTPSTAPAAPGTRTDAPLRVVLVDDDTLVRAGLRLILGGDRTIEIVGEAADGIAAVSEIARTRPDVVLMDIRMPRRDGLAALEIARAADPALKVIVLTTFDADDMVLTALRLGAAGFLLKDTPPAELVAAVRLVAEGRSMLSPSVTEQLITAVARQPVDDREAAARTRLARLTERELEVAVAIGAGLSNADIATSLFLSIATVKTHVGRVLDKLGADNRVQVAICVHDAGLA
ncbi:response regulator [Oerskovia jenensis]|uniref:response regulator n=1 Tax=Oerskovia jenensis TaxID=162169 RepID=UPI00196598DD|nr:response regulator transcription factor [Oerskovia jenensis]